MAIITYVNRFGEIKHAITDDVNFMLARLVYFNTLHWERGAGIKVALTATILDGEPPNRKAIELHLRQFDKEK